MKIIIENIKRNIKLFFKDKGLFFTSLITPLILLVLYATFLSNVFEDTFRNVLSPFMELDEKVIDGLVGGQLVSSLLAVSCITVSFCSNMLSVQDKVTKAKDDLLMTPCKKEYFAISYYIATFISTLLVCSIALFAGIIYLLFTGWYLSFSSIMLLILDVVILVLFGTTLSSLINHFLSSQGQISAVGSIVSSCYGFLCGAYMPISSFGIGLQRVLKFFPGTYGTSLFRKHAMGDAFDKLQESCNIPTVIDEMKKAVDFDIYFNDKNLEIGWIYLIIGLTTIVCLIAYILINKFANNSKK